MDKHKPALLGVALAIVFPTLLLLIAMTVVPNKSIPTYPSYPSAPYCPQSYNSTYTRTCDPTLYNQQQAQYQTDLKAYNDRQDESKKITSYRAELVLALAVTGTLLSLMLVSHIKEIVAGLVGGSAIAIVGAAGVLLSYMADNPDDIRLPTLFVTLGFVVLTTFLWQADQLYREPTAATTPTVPPVGPSIT